MSMSTLVATYELGTHPATALLLGGLATIFLRGRFASIVLVLAPLFGYFTFTEWNWGEYLPTTFWYEMVAASVDQQAKVFGYLFHIAALVAGIYSFHVRDPWQVSMALFYAASAVGVAFAGDMLSLFLWWEDWRSHPFFRYGGERRKLLRIPVSAICCFISLRGYFCYLAFFFDTTERDQVPWL